MGMINEVLKQRIIECYKEYLGENLISIVLFGSRARGDARSDSDYDLFIVSTELPESPVDRVRFIRRPIVGKFEEKISIIAKTREEFQSHFPPLFLALSIDGIVLYDKNYITSLLAKIKKIIEAAGLRREYDGKEYYWIWRQRPASGWKLDWEGFRAF